MTSLARYPHSDSKLFQPSTLDAALELIDDLRSSLVSGQQSVGRYAHVANSHFSDQVDDLVRIHAAIKAGRTDDALYDLEKVISTFDSGWRCRAA